MPITYQMANYEFLFNEKQLNFDCSTKEFSNCGHIMDQSTIVKTTQDVVMMAASEDSLQVMRRNDE